MNLTDKEKDLIIEAAGRVKRLEARIEFEFYQGSEWIFGEAFLVEPAAREKAHRMLQKWLHDPKSYQPWASMTICDVADAPKMMLDMGNATQDRIGDAI